MISDKVYNFFFLLFFGVLIVYLNNTYPQIIMKHTIAKI